MASTTITVPSFEFSSFYYAQILEALLVRKRIDVPELTDESDFEPFIQLLRSMALVGHLNNVLLDVVANENTLPTAQLTETVRNMLQLIDYRLASAAPASTELVYELARTFATSTEVIPPRAQAATRGDSETDPIFFEALDGVTVSNTEYFTSVQSSDGGVFTDHTAAAAAPSNFTPWATPATADALYFGHDSVMWTNITVNLVTALANIVGVWEYHDGDLYDVQPALVTNIGGGQLVLDLTTLLGAQDRRGATVRVTLNESGVTEDVVSTWNGSANVATVGLLGQTAPSTVVTDYTIGSAWTELDSSLSFDDETEGLTVIGPAREVTFDVPQNEIANWRKTTINGVNAFWIRFRVITTSGPTSPTLASCRPDNGKQYVLAAATQGRSATDDPLGSSTGAPNQEFQTSRDYFVDASEVVTVDDEEWTRVDNFLGSSPQDKHYVLSRGDNDRATVRFGDGVTGRIPPLAQGNISIDYRFNAEIDGNVGGNTIVVDKTGLSYVNRLWNPRQAGGWTEAEGASAASLERAKLAGPATLRTKDVALNGDDAIILAQAFRASDGTRPFGRATYIEEGFGPKTIELVLCGSGGVVPTAEHLAELELYFNGDKYSSPPVRSHYVSNQKVYAVAFDPYYVDLDLTVEAPESVTEEQIRNGVVQVVQPEALKADGVTFEWNFGGRVPLSRIQHEVFKVDDQITDVDVDSPASDMVLSARQLPIARTINVTVVQG